MITDDDRYIELFKLQKLFGSSFSVSSDHNSDSIDNLYSNNTVNATIFLKPTDPEFDLSLLSPSDGIKVLICLNSDDSESNNPSGSITSSSEVTADALSQIQDGIHALSLVQSTPTSNCRYYQVNDVEDIKIENENLSDVAKRIIQKVLFDYIYKNRKVRKYVVYESLKFLDKNLVQIFSIAKSLPNQQPITTEESKNAVESPTSAKESETVKVETPWTLEEQKCLEDGLVRAKGITDVRQKWLFISKIVKTRTPDQCRKRFIRCRELLLKKNEATTEPEREEPALDRTAPLTLLGLDMKKISLAKIGTFILELSCIRCASQFEAHFIDTGEKTILYNDSCKKCNVTHRCEFATSLVFPSQPLVGRLSLINTNFKVCILERPLMFRILTMENLPLHVKTVIHSVKYVTLK